MRAYNLTNNLPCFCAASVISLSDYKKLTLYSFKNLNISRYGLCSGSIVNKEVLITLRSLRDFIKFSRIKADWDSEYFSNNFWSVPLLFFVYFVSIPIGWDIIARKLWKTPSSRFCFCPWPPANNIIKKMWISAGTFLYLLRVPLPLVVCHYDILIKISPQ